MRLYNLEVHGIDRAMRGLARSFNAPIDRMQSRAIKLAPLDKGHNKFLRMIQLCVEVEAPRFWWAEYDTYKIGTTAQSDSTMHTLTKAPLTQANFEYPILHNYLKFLNHCIQGQVDLLDIKNALPEGFIQGRSLNLNYATLREITLQRHSHKLPQWQFFLTYLLRRIPQPELLGIPSDIYTKLVGNKNCV